MNFANYNLAIDDNKAGDQDKIIYHCIYLLLKVVVVKIAVSAIFFIFCYGLFI